MHKHVHKVALHLPFLRIVHTSCLDMIPIRLEDTYMLDLACAQLDLVDFFCNLVTFHYSCAKCKTSCVHLHAHTLIPLTFTQADNLLPCPTASSLFLLFSISKRARAHMGIWVPSGWLPLVSFKGEMTRGSCPRGGCLCRVGMSVGELSQG